MNTPTSLHMIEYPPTCTLIFPVVSLITGVTVAGCNHEHNTGNLSLKINRMYGGRVTRVGDPIPYNPAHGRDAALFRMIYANAVTELPGVAA